MTNGRFSLPEKKGYDQAYELAYKLACEQLLKTENIEQQCQKNDARYLTEGSSRKIIIQFLNQSYQITLPDIEFSMVGCEDEVPLKEKLLILHYFNSAKGTPATGRLITFRELPEGTVYFPTFTKRTVEPVLRYFGKKPDLLLDAAGQMGGQKAEYGDTAVTINAFSRVPITIVLWRGDEELTPQGSVLFDANVSYSVREWWC